MDDHNGFEAGQDLTEEIKTIYPSRRIETEGTAGGWDPCKLTFLLKSQSFL